MKKLVIGFALFGSVAIVGVAGRALAAEPAAGGDRRPPRRRRWWRRRQHTYKAKTVYDFEDDTVEGDLQRPDGEHVSAKEGRASSLIEIRKDFIPEMLKTLEDI